MRSTVQMAAAIAAEAVDGCGPLAEGGAWVSCEGAAAIAGSQPVQRTGDTEAAAIQDVRVDHERLLTAEEVAQSLGVTPRWVQRRARRLPFARQLSEHAIRHSEPGLKRWMAHRRADVA